MGLVARPPKAAGTSQYQTEFAAGAVGIQDTEVDADFETLYRLVNGNLDTSNLSAGAAIGYGQLSLTGRIMNSDIAAAAAIDGHKLAAGTVPSTALASTGSLPPGWSVPGGSVAAGSVGTAQLAAGATTPTVTGYGGDTAISIGSGQEVLMVAIPYASRAAGSSGLLVGIISGRFYIGTGGTGAYQLNARLRIGGGNDNTGTLIGEQVVAGNSVESGIDVFVPASISVVALLMNQTGTQNVKLTGYATGPGNFNFEVLSFQVVAFQWA